MAKKLLKGFANLGVIPVTENTEASYKATGEITKLPGAQTCAPVDNRESYSINADDGVYDNGAVWKNSTLTITVVETSLANLSVITGSTIDESKEEMEEGVFDNAPEVALTFSALCADGGYRLYRYYAAKCTGYKVTHTTRGQSNDAQTYELTFEASPRKIDGMVRGTKDVAKGTALTWLDTIPAMPAAESGV